MTDLPSTSARQASSAELDAWEWKLGGWRSPRGFAAIVQGMRHVQGDHAIDQPGSMFRDAFVASKCAHEWRADGVKLGADPPDFELKFGHRVERYEVAEVIAPGRMRSAELKADRLLPDHERGKPKHIPQAEWILAADALRQIEGVARQKATKGYPKETILVLYLNIWPIAGQTTYQDGIASAAQTAFPAFKQVWVLENGRLREIAKA